MLTVEQRAEFQNLGVLHLPGAIAPSDAAGMCSALWESLARHGVLRDKPETWTSERVTGIQSMQEQLYEAMGNATVRSALDDLFGAAAWKQPPRWGQPLVTFPVGGRRWDVPRTAWHLDAPASRTSPALPGVVVFAHLAPLLEHGGGTLMLAGSHRVVANMAAKADPADEGRSADMRRALTKEPWLRGLWARDDGGDRVQRFMVKGAKVRGVHLRVIELTGEPGDVIIWHPWLFHTATSNCRSQPRMVLRQPIEPASAPLTAEVAAAQ